MKHGVAAYVKKKCRCSECREVMAEKKRKWRDSRRRRAGKDTEECLVCGRFFDGFHGLVRHETQVHR